MITSPITESFKARLPSLKNIPNAILAFRAEKGITATLAVANHLSILQPSPDFRLQAKQYIAAANYSASQSRKELKSRGVK